jgi:hypothetical protein
MFSVTYTGMNFFPLCTAKVWPTMSGVIVERRDQVRITFFSFFWFSPSTFSCRWPSTNAPLLNDRVTLCSPDLSKQPLPYGRGSDVTGRPCALSQ